MKFVDAMVAAVNGSQPPVPYTTRAQATPSILTGHGGARAVLLGAMGANGTLFATVSRYANATSQVTWRLYRPNADGSTEGRRQVTSHLALDVWGRPNAFAVQQQFVEASQQHLELVGEAWWVIERNMFGWPESMWLVRPDRMAPVPSSTTGLAGYLYFGPSGEQVPIDVDQVIWLKQPNPADPGPAGRGLGAAQTILAQVESVALSAQWNRNFFANSAMPGGIIQAPNGLSDEAWKRLRLQWGEQHRGVGNAHRVGILEGGATWVSQPTQKDMEFSKLLDVSRDIIREAYSMPKFMLGLVDDVNRATADASSASFGTWGLVPRLERIKQALNAHFLPMFGPAGHGTGQPNVVFDFDDPVPPDIDGKNNELETKTSAYAVLINAGVDPISAAEVCGLPPMLIAGPPRAPLRVPSSTEPNGLPAPQDHVRGAL